MIKLEDLGFADIESMPFIEDDSNSEKQKTKEYNPSLRLNNYFTLLKRSSSRRLEREQGNYDRDEDDIKGWVSSKNLEHMLASIFHPLQDISKILARQEVLKYYIKKQAGTEAEDDLARTTKNMLAAHYELNGELSTSHKIERFNKIAPLFYNFMLSLAEFYKHASADPIVGDFASKIKDLVAKYPVTRKAPLLKNGASVIIPANEEITALERGERIGRSLHTYGGHLSRTRDGEGNLIENPECKTDFWLDCSAPKAGIFDLGLFSTEREAELKHYPGEKEDLEAMASFVSDSASLIYFLGTFSYQATIFNIRKAQGLPVCIPSINDEGRFKVKKAYPITTKVVLEPALVDFEYNRKHRKFIIGGAHSGGKTEFIRNMGSYHVVGLGGGILFCEEADIPITTKVITSIEKPHKDGKGSLESEVIEAVTLERDMGKKDLLLVDEFLDTSRPEVAKYVSGPLIKGEEGLCRGFAHSPGTIFIVDHRASRMEEDWGFEFISPVLAVKQQSETTEKSFLPTHTFAIGKPKPLEVQEHALQMWEKMRKEMMQSISTIEEQAAREIEPYGTINRQNNNHQDKVELVFTGHITERLLMERRVRAGLADPSDDPIYHFDLFKQTEIRPEVQVPYTTRMLQSELQIREEEIPAIEAPEQLKLPLEEEPTTLPSNELPDEKVKLNEPTTPRVETEKPSDTDNWVGDIPF